MGRVPRPALQSMQKSSLHTGCGVQAADDDTIGTLSAEPERPMRLYRFPHDELRLQQLPYRLAALFGVMDTLQQPPGADLSQFRCSDVYRGEGGVDDIGILHIVVAHDRHIPGHMQPDLPQRLDGAHRHEIAEGEHGFPVADGAQTFGESVCLLPGGSDLEQLRLRLINAVLRQAADDAQLAVL